MENQKIFYTVYRTTNLTNGMTYTGLHATTNIHDRYMGSGADFKKAVRNFGRENFKKEILGVYDTKEEMILAEKHIVTKEITKSEENYNLIIGGGPGGFPLLPDYSIGTRFGKSITITSIKYKAGTQSVYFQNCKCDCGREFHLQISSIKSRLKSNNHNYCSRFCSCRPERIKIADTKAENKSHQHMKDKCDNPNNQDYKYFGGKGITYSEKWKKFENFFDDMGRKPSKDYVLTRLDINRNFCKENCRWALPGIDAVIKNTTLLFKIKENTWIHLTDLLKKLQVSKKKMMCNFERNRFKTYKERTVDDKLISINDAIVNTINNTLYKKSNKSSPTKITDKSLYEQTKCLYKSLLWRVDGKGIKIKILWKSFEEFVQDMGLKPNKDMVLVRLNSSKEYFKENCKWILKNEYSNYSSNTYKFMFDGEWITLKKASDKLGLSIKKIKIAYKNSPLLKIQKELVEMGLY